MNRRPGISLVALLTLLACSSHLSGNGVLGTQARTVAPFDAVDLSLGIDATITANAAGQQVTLSGDENLLSFVLTSVEAGVLITRLHGIASIDSIHPLRITARATALHAVRATQAAQVAVTGAGDSQDGFVFEVEAGGASHVQLQGPGGHQLQVNLTGASGLDASSYPVAAASVALSGASTLRVHSTGDVTGSASEASHVEISGGGSCAALVLSTAAVCVAR